MQGRFSFVGFEDGGDYVAGNDGWSLRAESGLVRNCICEELE